MLERVCDFLKYRIRYYFLGGRAKAKAFARQRILNQRCCYDYPAENNGWVKYGSVPVYGNVETNSIFDPFVMLENNSFVLIVSERKFNSIIRLESTDGISWTQKGTILDRVPKTWQHIVNRATILRHNGVWHIWYTGQSPEISCIGHSISKDGINFNNAKEPCLIAELTQEGASVMNPCVHWNEKKQLFQMWYAAGETWEPDAIFYAESNDGDNWTKLSHPVLTKLVSHEWEKAKVGGCDVKIKADGTYEMYYIGYQNVDVARICYATSKDGIVWERSDNNLLIAPSYNSFDSHATYKPAVVEKDDKLYMWYNGRLGHSEYIGLATKDIKWKEIKQ